MVYGIGRIDASSWIADRAIATHAFATADEAQSAITGMTRGQGAARSLR